MNPVVTTIAPTSAIDNPLGIWSTCYQQLQYINSFLENGLNTLPAGANVPFVHSHKANEEIYGVLSGKGKVVIDGEEISLAAGDWLKISPMAKRQFFAASNSEITYICIQVKENSLEGYTATDAVIY